MRVMVALEDRFFRTPNGNIYSNTTCDYKFWQRYLQVFDEVIVLARVKNVNSTRTDGCRADGDNISFICLPCFIGPLQYFSKRSRVKKIVKESLPKAETFILRIPGTVGTLLWHQLVKLNKPYGVEVVGDPWDSLAPGSVKTPLRPWLRKKMKNDLYMQCQKAQAASYVTEYSLQKRYPTGGWSTYYSSIELPAAAILDDIQTEKRIEQITNKINQNLPWRICYAGTMNVLYKAPDILIEAVAKCINNGLNLELVMLGDGQYRDQLQQQAIKLGIEKKVIFLGQLSAGKAVYGEFDKSDLYILPSRQEGLPRSVIEAMARGLICIGTNVGGFRELLDEKFIVRAGSVNDLVLKIKEVLSDIDQVKYTMRHNVSDAKKYTTDVLQDKRNQFYNKIKSLAK